MFGISASCAWRSRTERPTGEATFVRGSRHRGALPYAARAVLIADRLAPLDALQVIVRQQPRFKHDANILQEELAKHGGQPPAAWMPRIGHSAPKAPAGEPHPEPAVGDMRQPPEPPKHTRLSSKPQDSRTHPSSPRRHVVKASTHGLIIINS